MKCPYCDETGIDNIESHVCEEGKFRCVLGDLNNIKQDLRNLRRYEENKK
jgi:hypothetical protein